MTIATMESKTTTNSAKLWRMEAFIKALGDPSKWSYTGQVNDLTRPIGKCICGHAIRFEFVIENDGQIEKVGSECINNFMTINPTLYKSLKDADKALKEQIKEAKKLAKELELNEKIQPVKAEYDLLRTSIKKYVYNMRIQRRWADYDAYKIATTKTKEFVRLSSYLKYLETNVSYFKSTVERLGITVEA